MSLSHYFSAELTKYQLSLKEMNTDLLIYLFTMKFGYTTELTTVQYLSPKLSQNVRLYFNKLIPKMSVQPSNYTLGRKQLWLFHSCNLRNNELKPSFLDLRLWNFCQSLYSGCNIALLTYGSNDSSGLIDWHRDHTYAQPQARVLNIGQAVFGYGEQQQEQHELSDGQLIDFNCKVQHAVLSHSSERFSLCMWRLNTAKGYQPLPHIRSL